MLSNNYFYHPIHPLSPSPNLSPSIQLSQSTSSPETTSPGRDEISSTCLASWTWPLRLCLSTTPRELQPVYVPMLYLETTLGSFCQGESRSLFLSKKKPHGHFPLKSFVYFLKWQTIAYMDKLCTSPHVIFDVFLIKRVSALHHPDIRKICVI